MCLRVPVFNVVQSRFVFTKLKTDGRTELICRLDVSENIFLVFLCVLWCLQWSSGGVTVYPDLIQYRVCAVVSAVEFRWFDGES